MELDNKGYTNDTQTASNSILNSQFDGENNRKYGRAMIIPRNWGSPSSTFGPSPSSKGQLGFESKSQAVVAVVRIGRSNSAAKCEFEATSLMPTGIFWELPKEMGYSRYVSI
jgi:hypothetical protein